MRIKRLPQNLKKPLALFLLIALFFSFAGIVRAAVYYSCGADQPFFNNFWYGDSGCTNFLGASPNLGGDSNDIYIKDVMGDASSLTLEGNEITLDGNDSLTIDVTGTNELIVGTGGILNVAGGSLALNTGANLVITSSGNIVYSSGGTVIGTGANITNHNTTGKAITFSGLPFSASAASSAGQDVSANVLTFPASGGDFFLENISYTTGSDTDATFSINTTTGYITVNGNNDVETAVAGTLTVGRTNGSGNIKQDFTFNIVDDVAPAIRAVTYANPPIADVIGPGDTVTILVEFDELITFVGSGLDETSQKRLQLNNGAYATLVATPDGSTNIAEFTYTVAEEDSSIGALDTTAAALELGADIVVRDSANNATALNTLVFPNAGASESLSGFESVRVDTAGPQVNSLSPTHNAVGVATDANVVLTFNESVSAVEGKMITIYSGGIFESINVGEVGSRVTVSGSEVAINPNSSFSDGTTYQVAVEAGAFLDAQGNETAEIQAANWEFTTLTPDTAAPSITDFSPADGAIQVPLNQEFIMTFDEAVVRGNGSITVYDSDNTVVDTFDAQNASFSGTEVAFTIAGLENNKHYSIRVASGFVEDTSGNYFTGISDEETWNFSTLDTAGPLLQSSTPADNATDVATNANIILTFNETVIIDTGTISIKKTDGDFSVENILITDLTKVSGSGTNVITINPNTTFEEGTEYYVLIDEGVLTDAQGNPYAGISNTTALSFTTATADVTDPGASGGGGGRSIYGRKPQEPQLDVRSVTADSIRIAGAHTGTSEDMTTTFGYTYKTANGDTKTVVLNRNVDDKVSFTETIDGLTCDTTYLVRVFAKNRAGTSADAAQVTTASCDGARDGVVEENAPADADGDLEATTSTTAEAYQAVQSVVCSIFTLRTEPGAVNTDVPRIKLFLNLMFPGLNLDVTSLVYDDATVAATKRFQMQYADLILKPIGLTQATGFWYEATMRQAHKVLGCQ